MTKNDDAIKTIEKLRAMGAVAVVFHVDGALASASFATALQEAPELEKPFTQHAALLKSEREELNQARLERQLREELGNE